MDSDSKLIFEALKAKQNADNEDHKSKLQLAKATLKDCLKHFSSEPTDPGHPHLLKLVKKTLEKIG